MGLLRRLVPLVALTLLYTSSAFADWYILLPKKPPAERRQATERAPVPKLKGKVKPKPYTVEVQKVLAPTFSIPTKRGKITKRELEGRNVVIFFVNSLFSPFTEKLVSRLERSGEKGTVFVVDSVNDADFASVDAFMKLMGVKKTVVTADSYLFYQFKTRLGNLKTPSVVVIDKYGFIRFFSPSLSGKEVRTVTAELKAILGSLSKG